MNLSSVPALAFTSLDGITQGIAALCYLAIGTAAWFRARHDIRTQVFLALSLANVVVMGVPTLWWLRGTSDPSRWPPLAVAAIMAGLGIVALLLFHFSQVFPRRRPWIRTSGVQMAAAYCIAPVAITGLVWSAPASAEALTVPYILAFIVFGFPLLVLLGIVLPVAAMVSLVRSYRDIRLAGLTRLQRPMEGILISQIAGGTLAVVFAPVLARVAPNSTIEAMVTIATWLLGLLTPIAFAAAVWMYDVLDVPPE
jgi:hypothetical protein